MQWQSCMYLHANSLWLLTTTNYYFPLTYLLAYLLTYLHYFALLYFTYLTYLPN